MNTQNPLAGNPSIQHGEETAIQDAHVRPSVVVNPSGDMEPRTEAGRGQAATASEHLQHGPLRSP
eukprot:5615078-Pyramimonas_sp.AAC.1